MEQKDGERDGPVSRGQSRQPDASSAMGDMASGLYERYAQRLQAVVRRRLGGPLRRKMDPEDVVQSVFRCFFQRVARQQYSWPSEASLWRLLVRLTQSKCSHKRRYYQAARRDVRREWEASSEPGGSGLPDGWEPRDGAATPDQLATLADTVAAIKRRLSTDTKRRIFELSLLGHSVVEISAATGFYERGVERVRAEIRDLLSELQRGEMPSLQEDAA
jgi:DNA-directed RNA polymerase specialized sigma24 family protein